VTRRAVLSMAAATAAAAFADERTEVLEIVSPLASALSNGDADAFLRLIPADSPNRTQLADNIRALLAQAEMTCSVQLRKYGQGRAELDWYMEIRSRATASMIERRKQIVTVRIRNREVFSIEPVDFFKPAAVR
jgi:hypothetical protein